MTPWQCHLFDPTTWKMLLTAPDGRGDLGALRIGDMCLDPDWARHDTLLSPEYRRDWAGKRDPILIVLPGPMWFCLDVRAHDKQHGGLLPNGWTVTGEPPRITVQPSIDTSSDVRPNGWHGWIKDGVIT